MTDPVEDALKAALHAAEAYGRMCARWYDRKPTSTDDTPISDLQRAAAEVEQAIRAVAAAARAPIMHEAWCDCECAAHQEEIAVAREATDGRD